VKVMKAMLIILLTILMTVQGPVLGLKTVIAETDVTKPVFKGVEIDKQEGTLGESVKVSVDAEDVESGIEYVYISYKHPVTDRFISKIIRDVNENGKYEMKIDITNELEEGQYRIASIHIKNNIGTETKIYNTKGPYSSLTPGLDLSSGDFKVSGTNADITKPVFNSVEIDKQEGTLGESVKVSVDAEDLESGIEYVYISYKHPETDRFISKIIREVNENGEYEMNIDITNDLEEGQYRIASIHIKNNVGTETKIYNTKGPYSSLTPGLDLSIGDFTVSGTNADITEPVFHSVELSKQELSLGESVKVSVDAEDKESGVEYVYISYKHPMTDRYISKIIRDVNENGKYEMDINITNELEEGQYRLASIHIKNNVGIETKIYNSSGPYYNLTPNMDLSSANFRIKDPDVPSNPLLETNEVVYYSQTWTNKTIDGDVYVAPNSVLKIDGDVTVNGDVYVLGVLNNYGDLTINGKITAKQFLWGSSSSSQGTVNMLGGTNSIPHKVATNKILQDVPIQFFNEPLTATNGIVNIEGAILPIVSLKVEGLEVPLQYNGTFKKSGINVGDKEQLNLTFIDVFGNQIHKEMPLTIIDTIHPTVSISPKGGYYASDKAVELSMSEKGEIYYTLNGSKPDKTSKRYEVPLSIDKDTVLKAIAYDRAGNTSEVQTEEYYFFKVEEITDKSTFVKGKAKPHSVITILKGENEWSAIAAEEGSFNIEIPKQTAGEKLTVYATDPDGNKSETIEMIVVDVTAPSKPVVNEVTDQTTKVTGTTEPGAMVRVKSDGSELGSNHAEENGDFTITIPTQMAGKELTVTSTDKAENISSPTVIIVKDVTPPAKPEVNEVTEQSTNISGKAEAGATVIAKVAGNEIGKTVVGENGSFTLTMEKQPVGSEIKLTVIDIAGNESESVSVIVKDVTNPAWSVSDQLVVTNHKETSLLLEWPLAKDNVKVVTYKIYQDGHLIGTNEATSTEMTVSNLSPGKTYDFSVVARDEAGNESKPLKAQGTTLGQSLNRISGSTRFSTATEISKSGWETSDIVLLARGYDFPDALAGAPLAYQLDAPVLLTGKDSLSDETITELKRLKAKKVILLGGEAALSESVEKSLINMKLEVERIAGSNRFETASKIAERLDSAPEKAILTYGYNFPDALAVASYAASKGYPILLTQKDKLPTETKEALSGTQEVYVIGGAAVIQHSVTSQLQKFTRISGSDRYETAVNIIDKLQMSTEKVYVATGTNFADALTGSVLAAKKEAPILLVKQNEIPKVVEEFIQKKQMNDFTILGGKSAVGNIFNQ
jgi:putative cell wall-binding protein/predicted DNA-binding protein/phenylpyruvate tautomerase PptA (4-oxalocrotonate tautomerase family)